MPWRRVTRRARTYGSCGALPSRGCPPHVWGVIVERSRDDIRRALDLLLNLIRKAIANHPGHFVLSTIAYRCRAAIERNDL